MIGDLQPTLTGKRLLLRPLREEDWDLLYAVAADPAIWALHPAHDRHEEPVFRNFFADAMASGGALVAIDKASGAIIGSSRYGLERAEPGEVEIGWTFLARDYWDGSYNGEMKRLMLRHAFGFAERAIFLVGEANLRSRKAMEKIGGHLTDRRQAAMVAGREIDHVIYAIDKADYLRLPLHDESA